MAARIAAAGVDAIYVSPYRRAQETAEPLARATGIAPVTLPGLAEIGVNVDGLSQEDVDRYFTEASQRPLSEHWSGWPGAETFRDFHARVTARSRTCSRATGCVRGAIPSTTSRSGTSRARPCRSPW